MSDLTVFVSTFNRIGTLQRCVALLERQARPKRIVIVDNGSQHKGAVALLKKLEQRHTVYRMPRIEDVPEEEGGEDVHGGHSMNAVQRNVSEAFRLEWGTKPRPRWYAMTDADVWLDGPVDSLDAYIELAEKTGRGVGPHLRLDTHANYPLRAAAILQHARILFKRDMLWYGDIPYSITDIDTTFHVFRAEETFRRMQYDPVRVGFPWVATHSDWLIDIERPTEENHAYILGCGEAASWGGRWLRSMFQASLTSPDEAFRVLSQEVKTHDDYFHPYFMLSWMYQMGYGVEANETWSSHYLYEAIPKWAPIWEFEEHWRDLIYRNDHSCLGW